MTTHKTPPSALIGSEVMPSSGPNGLELQRMPTAELLAELARGLSLTADHLTRLGQVWAELERRGQDLSELRRGLAEWLPLIAQGRLAAESVVAFATRRAILRALEGVPLEQQRRLAGGEAVEVIDPATAEGVSRMPLAQLPAAAVRLVLAEGQVRTPQAQRLALRPRRQPPTEPPTPRRYRPRYDATTGVVHVGVMQVRLDDLLQELSAASGPDRPPASDIPDGYATVRTRLTQEELTRLSGHCSRAGLPDWEMIRKALRAFGLI